MLKRTIYVEVKEDSIVFMSSNIEGATDRFGIPLTISDAEIATLLRDYALILMGESVREAQKLQKSLEARIAAHAKKGSVRG